MITIPAILEGLRSLKDKTLKIVFETNELDPEQHANIAASIQKFGYLAFKADTFSQKELDVLADLKTDFNDNTKTPSQRLRAVLYLLWQQDHIGYDDFQLYYNYQLEKVISHFKKKLP